MPFGRFRGSEITGNRSNSITPNYFAAEAAFVFELGSGSIRLAAVQNTQPALPRHDLEMLTKINELFTFSKRQSVWKSCCTPGIVGSRRWSPLNRLITGI
jgi:hypothetical protein